MPRVVPEYKEVAKSKIAEAALRVFAKKGYHGARMEDIAKELNISKATLYLYFKSKTELLRLIFQTLREYSNNMIKESDSLEDLERYHRLLMEHFGTSMDMSLEIIALSSHDENIKKIMREDSEEDLKILQAFIQKQIANGRIRSDVDASVLAYLVIALFWETTMLTITGVDKSKVHEIWTSCLAAILKP